MWVCGLEREQREVEREQREGRVETKTEREGRRWGACREQRTYCMYANTAEENRENESRGMCVCVCVCGVETERERERAVPCGLMTLSSFVLSRF